ncbi:hypothetical protein HJC23_007940 [Cyclotella cryptica]|uniref:Uncharacterized protein n=1 Tax=Cyclotella cryptica TaxID=29204 RepID=A0ABD3P9W2_9STRA|eukprot:CCRYP_016206-RA/>CCRYP_016206-RA protein AED:0.04 eAED:0.04 QI:3620/1/1/1/0.33/0.25/4/174/149
MNFQCLLLIISSIFLAVNGDYLRGYPEGTDQVVAITGNRMLWNKLNAAQKRQDQRDYRRRKWGVTRTEAEAYAERVRKHRQGNDRGNQAADPNEPGYGDTNYARKRESNRAWRCTNLGIDCNWAALDYDWPRNGHGGNDYDEIHDQHYP